MKKPRTNRTMVLLFVGAMLAASSYAYKYYETKSEHNQSQVVINKLSSTVIKTQESIKSLRDTEVKYRDHYERTTKHDTTIEKEIDTAGTALKILSAQKLAEKKAQDSIQFYKSKFIEASNENQNLRAENERVRKSKANINLQAKLPGEKNAVRIFPEEPGQLINNKPFMDFDQGNQLLIQVRSTYNFTNNTFQLGIGPELKVDRLSVNGGILYNPEHIFSPVTRNPVSYYLGTRFDIARFRFKSVIQ